MNNGQREIINLQECQRCMKTEGYGCCTSYTNDLWGVTVTRQEIERISKSAQEASMVEWRLSILGGYELVLVRADDGIYECPFLLHDRCTIFEDRPVACRIWPFVVVREFDDYYLALDRKCLAAEHWTSEEILARAIRLDYDILMKFIGEVKTGLRGAGTNNDERVTLVRKIEK